MLVIAILVIAKLVIEMLVTEALSNFWTHIQAMEVHSYNRPPLAVMPLQVLIICWSL